MLYFSVVTLTTVGYGDFAPQTDVGKLFAAVYVVVGVGILLAFVTTVAAKASQMPLLHASRSPEAKATGICRQPPSSSTRTVNATDVRNHEEPSGPRPLRENGGVR